MRRLCRIPIWLLLLFTLCCGHAIAPTSPAVPPPPLRLLSVQSAKVLYEVGEPVVGRVVVRNNGKAPLAITVRAWLEWQLDAKTRPQTETRTLAAGQMVTVDFTWKHLPEQFGYALKAEVTANGQPLVAGEDDFQISDNYWKASLINIQTMIYPWMDNQKYIVDKVAEFRTGFYNGYENFAWAPEDTMDMTPDTPVWQASLNHYHEDLSWIQRFNAEIHRNGMKAIAYTRFSGGGARGAEIARRHPDWVRQWDGVLAIDPKVQTLDAWDEEKPGNFFKGWAEISWNLSRSEVLETSARELRDSATQLGWDGARWDGTYREPLEQYDNEGKLIAKLTPVEAEAKNAANYRYYKTVVRAKHPRYLVGNNWIGRDFAGCMATNPLESIELCKDGGMVMDEATVSAEWSQDPHHRWVDFAALLLDDTERIKRLGGYYGPILTRRGVNPSADFLYHNAFAYAAGAHPYYHHLWGAFITRYSIFCWDPALTRLVNPETLVMAPDTVWWNKWVFERPLDRTHRQLIVHLFNPPRNPCVGDNGKAEDAPAPQKNVTVRLFPTFPDGWTPRRVARLTPESQQVDWLPLVENAGVMTVTIPELKIWNILVIDVQAGKGGR